MADDSAQDKELPGSAKRRQQARDKGQVTRSRDLGSMLLLVGSALALYYGGGWLFGRAQRLLQLALHVPSAAANDPGQALQLAGQVVEAGLWLLAPLLLLNLLLSVGGGLALGGWVFSVEALMPDFSRLDPVAGLGRVFSLHGLGELGKAALKALVLGVAALVVLRGERGALLQLLQVEPTQALVQMGLLCVKAFLWMALATALVAAVDVPMQIFQFNKKLKMSRQDMKDESRESEGNPEVKQRMRSLQRERARRRMMAAVPKADVVVTNPTHYAVALGYQEGRNSAPVVLAMGADAIAARIREVAAEHGVPLVEAPPLARALYRYAELEREIPATLYNAVALLLAYVYQLRALPAAPALPRDWPIPAELDTAPDAPTP
jgi:flagellar biosynthetic protein FlhB